ncbi:MAG: lipopolysaccharide biosynthesis protein [Puniceicoccaceae bacterium]
MDNTTLKKAALIHMLLGYVNYGLTLIQAILLVPLYLSYIGAAQYGLWLATGGILGWLSFLDMGLSSVTLQRVGRSLGGKDGVIAGSYFGTGYMLHVGLMSITIIISVPVMFFVLPLLDGVGQDLQLIRRCFFLATIGFALSSIANTLIGIGQAAQKTLVPGVVNNLSTAAGIVFIWYGLNKGWGLYSIPCGTILRGLILNVFLLPYGRKLIQREGGHQRFDKAAFTDLAKLSPFTFISKFGNGIVQNAEPLFLGIFVGPEVVVVYVLTNRAAQLLTGIVNRVTGSLFGPLSHISGDDNLIRAQQAFFKSMGLLVILSIMAAFFYSALNWGFVSLWVGPERFGGNVLTVGFALVLIQAVIANALGFFLGAFGDIGRPNIYIFIESVNRVILISIFAFSGSVQYIPYAVYCSLLVLSIALIRRVCKLFGLIPKHFIVVAFWYLVLVSSTPLIAFLGSRSQISNWYALLSNSILVGAVVIVGVGLFGFLLWKFKIQNSVFLKRE